MLNSHQERKFSVKPAVRGLICCLMLAPLAEISGEAQTPQSATAEGPIARWEAPATIAGIAIASTWSGLAHIENCRWCERTPDGADTVNQLDRAARGAMRWSDTNLGSANALSNVTIYAPVGLALLHRDLDKRGILTVVESLTATALIGQTIKVATARERPSFHYQSPANLDETKDRYTSFISGHSAQAFAAVASTARATAARHRPTKWLWLSGVPLAAATGYFRIAADRHYLTDTLAGAGVGLAVGYSVPALNAPRSAKRPTISSSIDAHGGQVTASWIW